MTDKSEWLELQGLWNEIYKNDNIYDGPFRTFSFNAVNFVFLNGVYMYVKQDERVKVCLDEKMISLTIGSIFIEIRYNDIDDFLIDLREVNNV